MKSAWLAIALAVLLLPSAPGVAQESSRVPLGTDATGDVEITTQGQAVPNPDRFKNLDITGFAAEEFEAGFAFHVDMASTEPIILLEMGTVLLEFAHREQSYRIRYGSPAWIGFSDFMTPWADLERHDPTGDSWDFVADLESHVEGNTLSAFVPRELLIDESGTAPFPGRELTQFKAMSEGRIGFYIGGENPAVVFYEARDEALPDGEAVLEATKGFAQTGHIRILSEEPTRASNGEATTFIYELKAWSLDGADDVTIHFSGIPSGWEVKASQGVVSLDAEGATTFYVKVDVPFAHQHGVTERFMVEARSLRDGDAVGRMELGVHYLEIPQLSGHHPTLYVHSQGFNGGPFEQLDDVMYGRGEAVGFPFMNSLQEFAGNTGEAMLSDSLCLLCLGGDSLEYTWSIPLSPSLRMGIDLNMSQEGEFSFEFDTGRPMTGVVATGELHYIEPDQREEFRFGAIEGTPIAELEAVELGDTAALATIRYSGKVTPLAAGDHIDYERGAQVFLVLRLTSTLPPMANGSDNPLLQQGGSIRLPLDEYADTVADLSGFSVQTPAPVALDSFDDEPLEAKDTPAPAAWALLAAAALLRRRL